MDGSLACALRTADSQSSAYYGDGHAHYCVDGPAGLSALPSFADPDQSPVNLELPKLPGWFFHGADQPPAVSPGDEGPSGERDGQLSTRNPDWKRWNGRSVASQASHVGPRF